MPSPAALNAVSEFDEPAVARRADALARRLRAAPRLVGKTIGSSVRLLPPGSVDDDEEAPTSSGPAVPKPPPLGGSAPAAAAATGDVGRVPACPSLRNPAPPASLPLKNPPPVPSPMTVGAVA
jgi:hypothetical protein